MIWMIRVVWILVMNVKQRRRRGQRSRDIGVVPHGFVEIVHLYLHTSHFWICWFDHFAFVMHITASFGPLLNFSQNNVSISQVMQYRCKGKEKQALWSFLESFFNLEATSCNLALSSLALTESFLNSARSLSSSLQGWKDLLRRLKAFGSVI